MATTLELHVSDGLSVETTHKASVIRNLAMTPEADELLSDLAQKTGLSEGSVLRVALGMFKIAVDAKQEGMHVGVASEPSALDVELVGF
jgi:hypothetical protein